MAQQVSEIKAEPRSRSGTGSARATRREDKVPGVVYGDGGKPENIALNGRELNIIIGRGKFLSTVFDLNVGGKKLRGSARVPLDPSGWPSSDFHRVCAGARSASMCRSRFLMRALPLPEARGVLTSCATRSRDLRRTPSHFFGSTSRPGNGRSSHLGHQAAEGVKPTFATRRHGGHCRPQDRGGAQPCARLRRRCRRSEEGEREPRVAAPPMQSRGGKAPAGKEAAGASPAGKEAAKPAPARCRGSRSRRRTA